MRNKLKRLMALWLALLTVISSVAGYVIPVKAASAEANICFWYASASEHGVVSEFNSSHTGMILYAMIDGKIGYCLNYGLSAETGTLMKSDDEPSNTTLSAKQEKLLALCLYYGYADTADTQNEPSNDKKDQFIATQSLVWIIEKGLFDTIDADNAAWTLSRCAPDPDTTYGYYCTLRNSVDDAYSQTIPSFASKKKDTAETKILKWNETNKRYEITLKDDNKELKGFDLSLDGYKVEKDGNTLTISTTKVHSDATLGTFTSNTGKVEPTSSCVFWFSGKSSDQEFVSERPTADPIYAYIKVKTEDIGYGYLEKVDKETGTKLKGATYGIYSDSGCSTLVEQMVTGDDGGCKSGALTPGTYYVKEISSPAGYVLDKDTHTLVVKAGKTTTFTAKDSEQVGALTIYKEGEVLVGWNGTNFTYEKRKLKGATFKVTAGADIYRADGQKVYNKGAVISDGLVTGNDGQVTLNNLHLGTYNVQETKSIDGYTINGEVKTVKIEYKDQTVEVQYESTTILNKRQKANVTVSKIDKDTKNPLKGGEYTIYAGNDIKNYDGTVIMKKDTTIQTVTTGDNGSGKYSVDFPISNSFYVKETKAPYGYLRNETDVYSFTFSVMDQKTETAEFKHTFSNDRVTAKIHLYKVDKDTGKPVPQGDASLEGAVYGLYAKKDIVHPDGKTGVLYKAGTKVAELKTNAKAEAEVKNLYLGEYYVKEIEPPVGYNLDTVSHDVECSYEGDKVAEVARTVTSEEEVKKQPFQLIKVSDNGEDTEAPLLEGAGFTAYLKKTLKTKEDGNYDFDSAKPIVIGGNVSGKEAAEGKGENTIYTDKKGHAVSIPIPYGDYVVVESVTPHNMETVRPFEVKIREHKPTEPLVWRVFIDREFSAKLRIIKKDDETKKTILLPDTEFRIFNMDTEKYVEMVTTYPSKVTHKTFKTDDDGDLLLPDVLHIGNYRIEEVVAPYGYVKNKNYVEVAVDTDTFYETDPDTYEAIITVTYENHPTKGEITVEKRGEVLDGYEGGWFADSDEKEFVYVEGGLEGAEFEVYANEDIYTADNQVDESGNRIKYYSKDDFVATLITDKDGKAVLKDIPLGQYRVVETKAPFGYLLDPQEQTSTLVYADDETPVIYDTKTFKDEREKLSLMVEKRDIEDNRAIEGAVFGLYAGEDIKTRDGKVVVEEGTLLEVATSDADGLVKFIKDYPFGKYVAKEIKAPNGYVSVWNVTGAGDSVDDATEGDATEISNYIEFDARYIDENTPVAEYVSEFLNTPTSFEFSKEDITSGAELSGATLSVIDEDGNVVETWTSKAGEKHILKRLVVGETYILREEFAPYGYLRATDIEFTVEDTDKIQSVVMKDAVPTGTIIINKDGEFLQDIEAAKDKWYDFLFSWKKKSMAGVTFEVYAKEDIVSPDGLDTVYYQKDALVATLVTNDKGVAYVDKLPLGKYYLVETSTLDGFILDSTPKDADLSYIDQDTPIVYAGDHIFNERQKADISVIKKDSETGKGLPGAMFGVYAAEDIKADDTHTIGDAEEAETEDTGAEESASKKKDLKAGTLIEKAVTDSEGKIHFVSDLPLGKYYIQEIEPPKGYAFNKEKFDIDASYNPKAEKILKFEAEFTDVPIKVEFSKTDVTGDKELEGAKLSVIDSDGKTVESWTSTKEPHIVEKIPAGKYTLREEISPYGYTIANDIEFEVKDSGEIQKCQMKDEYVFGKLLLKKRDAELNTMIEGVEFEIRDKDGKVLQTLTTGKDGCAESDLLPICTFDKNGTYDKDITYTVVETKAKDGYILDSTPHEVVFSYGRDKDGKILDDEVKAPELVEYTLDLTNKSTEPKLPQTGDDFNPFLLGAVGLMFILMGVVLFRYRKDEDIFDEAAEVEE